jgi:dipeptidyl aminopeptidase/acylaminoacyl peptidase
MREIAAFKNPLRRQVQLCGAHVCTARVAPFSVRRQALAKSSPLCIAHSPSMTQAFEPEDVYLHRVLGGLVGSADGSRVVCKSTRALRDEDTYRACVHGLMLDVAGNGRPRRFTADTTDAKSPQLSPDGECLAFLSSRDDAGMQVQLLRWDGGEARQLTTTEDALSTIEDWSPDGRRLLLTAEVECSEQPQEGDRDARRRTRDHGKDAPHVARFLPYKKDGSGVIVGKRVRLLAADVDSGDVRAVVQGDFDAGSARWSPSGARIAYTCSRTGRQRHRKDLWLAHANGDQPRQRTHDLASVQKLAWSPDGRRIALMAAKTEGSARTQLWLLDADGDGSPRLLGGEDFELATSSPLVWHPDGRRLAVIAMHRGLQPLAVVDIESGIVTRLRDGLRQAYGLAACGERLVYIATSMRWPDELYSVDWEGRDARRHSAFNRKWFRARTRPRVVKRRFDVPDGAGGQEAIDAWLLLPPQGTPPHPLLVDAHGGPQSGVLADFAMHSYWYLLVAQGWAVLAPNAVGSSGYGAEFARRISGHWGELDFPQYEAIVDTLQREGLADDRLAITGKSYGGYLAAWAIGHARRYRAAIVAAPVSNILSHAGTSDTGYYVAPYTMCGELPTVAQRAYALSPVAHCTRATTPTLILQGKDDGRCPLGQAEELFANLMRCTDTPVELVIYPGGTHGLAESGKPSHRVDYHQRLCHWATRWTLQEPARQQDKADGAMRAA